MATVDLKSMIRDVPDFPQPGIVFKDTMPLLANAQAFAQVVDELAAWAEEREPEVVLGAEARGFITGAALAYKLGCGFIPARKPGKLPRETVSAEYVLEYGIDSLQMQADAFREGTRVLVHDDLLATGGTAKAKCDLVERLGGVVVGVLFIISLEFLNGRDRLANYDVHSLIQY
jgi:adenine phosphoribosyltransferase